MQKSWRSHSYPLVFYRPLSPDPSLELNLSLLNHCERLSSGFGLSPKVYGFDSIMQLYSEKAQRRPLECIVFITLSYQYMEHLSPLLRWCILLYRTAAVDYMQRDGRWLCAQCSVMVWLPRAPQHHIQFTYCGVTDQQGPERGNRARGDVFLTFLHLGIWTETHTSLKREKCALRPLSSLRRTLCGQF